MSIFMEHGDHRVNTHELHAAIRDLGLDHHGEGYLKGLFDGHAHDGSISGHGIHEVLHKLKETSHSGVHHEAVERLSSALGEHFTKTADH